MPNLVELANSVGGGYLALLLLVLGVFPVLAIAVIGKQRQAAERESAEERRRMGASASDERRASEERTLSVIRELKAEMALSRQSMEAGRERHLEAERAVGTAINLQAASLASLTEQSHRVENRVNEIEEKLDTHIADVHHWRSGMRLAEAHGHLPDQPPQRQGDIP